MKGENAGRIWVLLAAFWLCPFTVDVVVRAGNGGSLSVVVVDRLGKATWYQTVSIPER